MRSKAPLEGSWVALVTPFRKGEIDWTCLDDLVFWQIEKGTDGLVLCGTTAESPTLTETEQLALVRRVVKNARGKIRLMAGCGTNSTAKTLAMAQSLEALGLDAFLVITPYYNRPTQRGLLEHYGVLARSTRTPLVIYNVPSRTGVNMEPQTVLEAARRFPAVVAIKEASGILDQASFICRGAPEGFSVLSGDDSLTLPMLSVGARGVISVAANVVPDRVAEMVHAWLGSNPNLARKIHLELTPIFRGLFIETNPIPVKTALWKMGKIATPELRLPLVAMAEENEAKLSGLLHELGLMGKKTVSLKRKGVFT